MDSIVIGLQREAQESKGDILTLLRKAYVVARKLKIPEFEEWLDSELKGYRNYKDVPEYRRIYGEIKARNPYRGWIPVMERDSSVLSKLNNKKLMEPIVELQAILKSKGVLAIKFEGEFRERLSDMANFETEFALIFNRNQIEKILEEVRTIVLDWALRLEEEGIFGEGMNFSNEEREKAKSNSSITNIFHGDTTGVQIQQQSSNSHQNMNQGNLDVKKVEELLQTIKENIPQLNLNNQQKEIIHTNIEMIEKQNQLNNPNSTVIREGLNTVRNVLEGITGSIIASGIVYHLELLLN